MGTSVRSGTARATLFQDYDWADEALHVQIGRKWLAPVFGNRASLEAAIKPLWERWERAMTALRYCAA
jgi:hypothetical protein